MGLSGKLLQIIAVPGVIIIFAIVAAAAATTIVKPGCPSMCGNVEIPFPFGLTEGCYLDESFNITCDSGKPKTGNVTVTNISIDTHELHVLTDVAQDCYQMVESHNNAPGKSAYCSKGRNLLGKLGISDSMGPRPMDPRYNGKDGAQYGGIPGYNDKNDPYGRHESLPCVPTVRVHGRRYKNKPEFRVSQYTISNSKNKFTVIGCDTIAYLSGFQNGEWYNIGCASQCPSLSNVVNGSCFGVGCCELGFPDGLKNISVEVYSFYNHSNVWGFNPCGYAFVVEKGQFNFSAGYLNNYPNQTVPLVLDWAVGILKCDKAHKEPNYACKDNSDCIDLHTRQDGYRCKCKRGYKGNPYLLQGQGGCQDIDECKDPTLNNCTKLCTNGIGNYTCGCPKWYRGDGRKDGEGCSVDVVLAIKVSIGIGIGLIAMLGGSSWLFLVFQKRKYIKLQAKLFQQNGGLILQRRLRALGSTKKSKIFTFEELKVATKNYRENRVIGQGGFGTVYQGFLPNNTIVAIKKSKTVDPYQVDQFINEIVLLSQIDHKNVVKLLGCCLETQVPLLVYEFVSQGTLFNYIHRESNTSTKRWETYLRIAAETADALSYLHSLAIIHRDVKPSNILLGDNFTAKVSDFEISKLVPHDQKDVATVVQGTLGYLDPEYLQTNQLKEKSDVYSFGVVLMELLTGNDVFSFDRSEDERCLAMYFLSFLKEDRMDEILDKRIVEEGNKEQIKEVVKLAERCLRVKGDERPSMKELAMELEQIRKIEAHLWVNAQTNLEGAEHLDGVTSNAYENGGSSNTTAGFDSMKDNVMLALGDGR
ncbi:wall-associated receptor kinase 5-like [Corylus avellana]|uniref:wall-associated receptor kinase 5-like n=1 Tax=Corylus avellana TaxID=13451 RepID=UPI001E20DB79|nr:wall-associated receptor kinase 5-like [Corylus avellana]